MNSTSLRYRVEFGYMGDEDPTTYEKSWIKVFATTASKYEMKASEAVDKGIGIAQDFIYTRFTFRNDRRLENVKSSMQIRCNGFVYEIKSLPIDADSFGRWKQIEAVRTTQTY